MEATPLQGRLLPSERILWSGAPAKGLLFTGSDVFLVPFSLLWCGFAVFFAYNGMTRGASSFAYLWQAAFVCIGLFFVFGRFIADAWLRRRTVYAVTDQRILILRSEPFASFTSIDLERLPDIRLTGERSARGNVRFGTSGGYSNRNMSMWMPALDPTPQFLAIDGAAKVFNLIVSARHESRLKNDAEPR
jgi:hypothetical protein